MPDLSPRPLDLLAPGAAPRVRWSREHHDLPLGAPLGILVCAAVAGFAAFAVAEVSDRSLPLWNWILLLAGLAPPVFFALWIGRLLAERIRAALRSTNWIARVADDALYLNLRSWLNWRLPEGERTVVRIPWNSIAGVHEVREQWRAFPKAGARRGFSAFVAIRLHPGTNVDDLDCAVRAEVHRVITHPDFVRGVAAWNEVPVFVGPDGCVWVRRVEMSLLRALARRVPRGPRESRLLSVGPELDAVRDAVTEPELAALVLRGQWSNAQQLAQRRLGLGYDESVRLLERLFRNDAPR